MSAQQHPTQSWRADLLVLLGRSSPAARRWIMRRAWDEVHRKRESEAAICGRLLVGQGSDTYDPLCVLSPGHTGRCAPEPRPALPLGVGAPSITAAPEVRIAETPSGKLSVWVAGVGYLSTEERHELGRLLAGVPR